VDPAESILNADPATYVRPGIHSGTPVTVNGRAWLFADHVRTYEPVWDRLYDSAQLTGHYPLMDVMSAAVRLLYQANDLTPDEAATVVAAADPADLVPAVDRALYGPERSHRTWGQWVESSLLANGLNPATIPPDKVWAVLDMLVMTGRTVPAGKFVSSAEAAAMRRGILGWAGGAAKPKPAPAAPDEGKAGEQDPSKGPAPDIAKG
jgi:hypothetical protein